jgi:SOS-response transcriptional repressor LexA
VINIKEEIGRRILVTRKAKGLTQKALGELTDDLKQSRINNWEHGIRTPGPEEIKQLAKALDVSPAYLMCLTDQPKEVSIENFFIPLLNHVQASDPNIHIQAIKHQEYSGEVTFIPVSTELAGRLGECAFALKMIDDSMIPEMRINDIQIIDPSASFNPSDYVAVKISGKPEVIICQYKKLSYTSSEFELMTLNDNWPNITVNENVQVEIVGKVVQNTRCYF